MSWHCKQPWISKLLFGVRSCDSSARATSYNAACMGHLGNFIMPTKILCLWSEIGCFFYFASYPYVVKFSETACWVKEISCSVYKKECFGFMLRGADGKNCCSRLQHPKSHIYIWGGGQNLKYLLYAFPCHLRLWMLKQEIGKKKHSKSSRTKVII